MVFTEGTVIMHCGGIGRSKEEIIKQVRESEKSVLDWAAYVPIGSAVTRLKNWQAQGAEIFYLTSRLVREEVDSIRKVLEKHRFPTDELLYRREGQQYRDVAQDIVPDVLVEDDCESIGGRNEMTITHVRPEIRKKIKSIPIKEFGGIDHLTDKIDDLIKV